MPGPRRTLAGPVAAVAAVAAVTAVALVPALPAAASCAGPLTTASLLEQGGDVVLGVSAQVDGSRVLLDVEEVWSGEDRAPEVRTTTGETRPGTGSSGDVELDEGRRHLVGLLADRTDVCSVLAVGGTGGVVTAVTAAEVDAARPADVRGPMEGADLGADPGLPVAAVAAGLALWALLTAVVLLAGRSVRRRQQRRARRGARRAASTDGGGQRLR